MSVADEKPANSPRSRAIINNLAPHFHQLVRLLTHKQARENVLKLTPREREVLLWAMEGKSNWEISIILGISQESIKGHIANILRKLEASRAVPMQSPLLCNMTFCFLLEYKVKNA